ncbi:hypothetical protein JOM56_009307 [Amanita muscaria]
MSSEDNGPNPLEKFDNLDHMNALISSSPGRQASSTPPMPPSTQKRPCSPFSANSAPGYAHHSGYATTFSSSSMSPQDRSLAETIGLPFPEFDHKQEVIDPFSEDENRDQAFQEELTEMLLDALIETHAWSTARLKPESLAAAEKFEAGISNIIEVQTHQGT